MGRAKIEIKYIENTTNRRATYSKRKKGILKKANELTILCDAQVCVIMFSDTGKLAEYVSPSTTIEEFFDMYQKKTNEAGNVNLLKSLQKELKKQKKINSIARKEIGQRTGQEDLGEFSYGQLVVLKEDLHHSLAIVRHRKAKREQVSNLIAVPSQVALQLLPRQPNLHDAGAAGGQYF